MALGIGLMIASTIMEMRARREQRREYRRRSRWEVRQLRERAEFIKEEGAEQIFDLKREEAYTLGEARSRGAAAGTSGTTFGRIESDYRRAGERISRQVDYETSLLYTEAGETARRGRATGRALNWEASASLFSSGYQIGASAGLFGGDE